jgi:hypothetical protein
MLKRLSATYFGIANQSEQEEVIKKQKEVLERVKS